MIKWVVKEKYKDVILENKQNKKTRKIRHDPIKNKTNKNNNKTKKKKKI